MKKKLFCMFLLLALVFATGCNKEKSNTPAPTPTAAATTAPTSTPTPTPTPVPENLAKTNLDKLPEQFGSMMTFSPVSRDFSNGIGYDLTMDISLGNQIVSLLGLEGLEKFGLSGSFDIKDTIAANLSLNLNSSEVISAQVFADASMLFFNLPAYSASYAASTWEDLLESADMDASALSGINMENLTASSNELNEKLQSNLTSFVNCFDKVDGVTKDVTIGTGDYTMTGEKHTVKAEKEELRAALTALNETLVSYMGSEAELFTEEFLPEESSSFIIDYYTDAAGNYAWVFYPDTEADNPAVFINTEKGFCLYTDDDGTISVLMSSVKTSGTTGTVTMFTGDSYDETLLTADYTTGTESFAMEAKLYPEESQTPIELSFSCSTANETLSYDLTIVVEGMSIVMEQTATKDTIDLSMTLASYGVKYGAIDYTIKLRDYAGVSAPTATTTMDNWAATLDTAALTSDLLTLMQEYPFLLNLLNLSEEDFNLDNRENDWVDDTTETQPFEMPAGYTDDFMNMTGYAIDEDGYVDFEPLPDEVFAAGKPSTGLDTIAISDDQIQTLFDIALTSVPNCEAEASAYYWVWGSVEYDDVRSYYTNAYDFEDTENWDNSVSYNFDAVSGGFSSVSIYHTSKDEALRIANEIFQVLGGDYTITAELVEEYSYDSENGFYFSGYDAAQYGGSYYTIEISIYWD